jgi:hypothetical protein
MSDDEADVNDQPPPDPAPTPSSDPASGYEHPAPVITRRRLGGQTNEDAPHE